MLPTYKNPGRFFLLSIIILTFTNCSTDEEKPVEGISKELAEQRKNQLSHLSYNLFFDIPAEKEQKIQSEIEISFEVSSLEDDLVLDFTADPSFIKSLIINGKSVEPMVRNQHIIIDNDLLDKKNAVKIEFIAGNQSLNRQDEFLYTLFVPARASSCFPLFDQPDLKANYKLALSLPGTWEGISNTEILTEKIENSKKILEFAESELISSYLFAFAAGKFEKVTKTVGGRTYSMYHRESDSAKVAKNINSIYEWHGKSINWLEEYTSIGYPFKKLDFVLIPSFQYGGMEHPGAIFYKSSSLMLSESATLKQKLSKAQLIAHEVSHMWFGDLVTMDWFNDVWLKEVFANFMADKIVSPEFSAIDTELNFLMSHYPRAYEVDRTQGTHPIAQPLENLKDAGSLYGSIIYQKAPIVMRKLEKYIGEAAFQNSMKEYLEKYSFKNASWEDLLEIIKMNTDKNIDQWNKIWVESAGMPMIRYVLKRNEDDKVDRFSTVSYSNDEFNQLFSQQIDVQFYWPDSSAIFHTTTGDKIEEAEGIKMPEWLYTNASGTGYGYFYMTTLSQDSLLAHINNYAKIERASLWINFNEALLNGNLSPNKLLRTIMQSLPKEKDDLIAEYILGVLESVYWNLMTNEERKEISNQLEGILLNMALGSSDNSIQGAYFNSLQSIAISEGMIDILYKIWSKEMIIEGLSLSESDNIKLAKTLAVKHDKGDSIFTEQIALTKNQDVKNKLEYIKPAISGSHSERDEFFNSLSKKEQRANEEWVIEALEYLHHPLRRETSNKYITASLNLSEEIQSTGDIFFLKNWLDATLLNYNSEKEVEMVRQYLYKNHRLPVIIKREILQSADCLFRYSEIMKDENENSVGLN